MSSIPWAPVSSATWPSAHGSPCKAGQPCGDCARCVSGGTCVSFRGRGVDYDGGWSQYTIAREDTVVPIPDTLPFDQAAIIPDAVSTSYAALVGTVQVRSAQAVGIWESAGWAPTPSGWPA
ncbi:hypothetical protein ACFV2U_28130 [Streptomyces sp. NPDC059697]|uniref:hypothetical protein n=1 Tax=Streptomyces sp. NPDC059697 TaxID=3346912 RepID=UPI0036A61E4C